MEAYAPAWSPTGERLAFQSEREIMTVRGDGTDLKFVVLSPPGSWRHAPAWSPDSQWLACVGKDGPYGSGHRDVYAVPATWASVNSQRMA